MKTPEIIKGKVARASVGFLSIGLGIAACSSNEAQKANSVAAESPATIPPATAAESSTTITTNLETTTTTIASTTTEAPTTTRATVPALPPVRSVNVNNLTFRADTCQFGRKPWEMKNGVATQTNQIPGESYPVTSELSIKNTAYGDINADGVEDVVILFDCKIPRERSIQMIGAYAAGETSLVRFGEAGLPESTLALSVSVPSPGNIRVEQTGQSFAIYEWQGNGLARQGDL